MDIVARDRPPEQPPADPGPPLGHLPTRTLVELMTFAQRHGHIPLAWQCRRLEPGHVRREIRRREVLGVGVRPW